MEIQEPQSGPSVSPAFSCLLCHSSTEVQEVSEEESFSWAIRHLESQSHKRNYLARHMPTVLGTFQDKAAKMEDKSRLAKVRGEQERRMTRLLETYTYISSIFKRRVQYIPT